MCSFCMLQVLVRCQRPISSVRAVLRPCCSLSAPLSITPAEARKAIGQERIQSSHTRSTSARTFSTFYKSEPSTRWSRGRVACHGARLSVSHLLRAWRTMLHGLDLCNGAQGLLQASGDGVLACTGHIIRRAAARHACTCTALPCASESHKMLRSSRSTHAHTKVSFPVAGEGVYFSCSRCNRHGG